MHAIKSRSMKLQTFISMPQKLSVYLGELPPDITGQETVPLPSHL